MNSGAVRIERVWFVACKMLVPANTALIEGGDKTQQHQVQGANIRGHLRGALAMHQRAIELSCSAKLKPALPTWCTPGSFGEGEGTSISQKSADQVRKAEQTRTLK